MFSIYTGIPFSDLEALTMDDITEDEKGRKFIKKERRKTEIDFITPLMKAPLQIVEKYTNDPKRNVENKILPVISNQKYNA